MIMLDYRNIHFITDEERAEIAASQREANDLAYQRELEALDQWQRELERGGRPSMVLPPEIARRVLADLEACLSHRAIELKYKGTRYPFSRRWLVRAIGDGRLLQMAGLGHWPGQNMAQNGNALTQV